MSDINLEVLAAGRSALERWQTPAEFIAKVEELDNIVKSDQLFNLNEVKFLQDALGAGGFRQVSANEALAAAGDRESLVLIELVMSRLDAPGPLTNFAQRCAEFNFPQLATLLGPGA